MRGFIGVVAVLCVTVMTGCPSEYGREGRISEAMLKDETENPAPPCSPTEAKEVCGNGKLDTPDCQRCLH